MLIILVVILIYIFNFDGNWIESLPTKRNMRSLGWKKNISNEAFDNAKALHWTGKRKPWLTSNFEKRRWWNKMFWWKEYDENSKLLPRICSAADKSNPRRW
jgi:lipopolysaccharide biosynthesis glycosyltransferase